MPSEHEHGFLVLAVQLLEQDQRFLLQSQAALLVAVDNVQRILPPVGVDVVLLQRGRKHFVARVFHADPE